MSDRWKILVVDDEPIMRESLAAWLREDGYRVDVASGGRSGLEMAAELEYDAYFIDLKMPGMDGIETMIELRRSQSEAAVIIITAFATVDTAITAIKEGAQEYVVKPCNPQEISLLLHRIFRMKTLERENRMLREKLTGKAGFAGIVSKSKKMREIFSLIEDVAPLRSTVLIQGESGTGKDLVARAIHQVSGRKEEPFVGLSCAALAETLLESELFGYERGAFTGATDSKKGKFELAGAGTLFLDEIGDISPKLQLDLLRVLQERKIYRIGGAQEIPVEARIVAATNAPLLEAVEAGKFREDLYYRLNVINIRLPPLRERIEDVPLLVGWFVEKFALEMERPVPQVSDTALALLMDQQWPGNVRQLENAVERAMVTCKGSVLEEAAFRFLVEHGRQVANGGALLGNRKLADIEREAIEITIERTGGNVKAAAEILGIDRSTVYERLKRYGIKR